MMQSDPHFLKGLSYSFNGNRFHQVYEVQLRSSWLVDAMIVSLLVILLVILVVIGVLWIIGKIAWTLLKWLIIIIAIALVISWLLNL
jgi:hypothetical protein